MLGEENFRIYYAKFQTFFKILNWTSINTNLIDAQISIYFYDFMEMYSFLMFKVFSQSMVQIIFFSNFFRKINVQNVQNYVKLGFLKRFDYFSIFIVNLSHAKISN